MRPEPITPPKRNTGLAGGITGEIDLAAMFQSLIREKWRIFAFIFLGAILGIVYIVTMTTSYYVSTAAIALQSRNERIIDFQSPLAALGGDTFTINTEVEALQSRRLAEKLAERLDLFSDPEFNYTLQEPRSFSPGSLIRLAIGTVKSIFVAPEPPGPPPTSEEIRADVISSVLGALTVSNTRASYVFNITFMTQDPEKSARMADALAELYIEDQIAVKFEATERATAWLSGRVIELRDDLVEAENALKSFKASSDLVGPEALEALNRQLKDRRDRVADAEAKLVTAAATQASLRAAGESGDTGRMAVLANDPVLTQAQRRLPEGRAAFDARFAQIVSRGDLELQRAREQIKLLKKSVADLESKVVSQSDELVRLQQLEREAAASREIYEHFLGRLKQTSVQQGVHSADSRMLSTAVVDWRPAAPRKTRIVMLFAFMGMVLGAFAVLRREMRKSGARSAQELEQATGYSVLAQIPKVKVTRKNMLKHLVRKHSSAMAEAVRDLRTSVLLSHIDQAPQIIMITSSLPDEGKTSQSLALTQSFAALGNNVLLIEGDIRRRVFRSYFKIRNPNGLIAAVSGNAPLEDCVHYSEELGSDVLVGEKSSVNAADFFSSTRFKVFLESCREKYDIIIIDTPPVLAVPDARVIGPQVDATIYAVRWDQTALVNVQDGLTSLESIGVKVTGLSLSMVDMRQAKRYGGKYADMYGSYAKSQRYYAN